MKKYLETAKIHFKTQMAYRFDITISMIFTITKILLAYVLWTAIFGKQNTIAGFTFNTMLSYYIINSFLSQLDQSSNIAWQMAAEIKNGSFSKYIIRPMGIFGYFTAQTFGISAFLLLFNLFAAVIWVFIFHIDFAICVNPPIILPALLLILLGLLFMVQMNYFVGLLAFKFIDPGIFIMIKDNMMQFVTGALIPLTLLPSQLIKGMTFFPFYYISYLPTMLLLGKNEKEAITGLIVLLLWNIGFCVINAVAFKYLKSDYDGVGI